MNFGDALEELQNGSALAREGWNADNQFVYLVPAASYPAQTRVAKIFFGEVALVPYAAYFALKNAQNKVSTWVPSVSDCLADDWFVVEVI